MRRLVLTAAAALALTGCGKKNQTDNANLVGDNLTAEAIVSNDVTAIDAVTGDAANMAADVDMNYADLGNGGGGGGDQTAEPARPTPREKSRPEKAAIENGAAASTSNSTTNAE